MSACPKCKGWGKVRINPPQRGQDVIECDKCHGTGAKS